MVSRDSRPVDCLDYILLKRNFGSAIPSSSLVPEPTSLLLFVIGSLAMVRAKRR